MLKFTNNYNDSWGYTRFKKDYLDVYKATIKNTVLTDKREVSIVFLNNKEMKEINKKYRNKTYDADVISFAFDEGIEQVKIEQLILGEIFINVDQAKKQAKEYNHSLKREMSFLFLHGLLHILGYNHIEKEEEEIMFGLQDKILNYCGIRR